MPGSKAPGGDGNMASSPVHTKSGAFRCARTPPASHSCSPVHHPLWITVRPYSARLQKRCIGQAVPINIGTEARKENRCRPRQASKILLIPTGFLKNMNYCSLRTNGALRPNLFALCVLIRFYFGCLFTHIFLYSQFFSRQHGLVIALDSEG